MKIAIVGGAGFIGSHFAELALQNSEIQEVVVIDLLTYAGRVSNLSNSFKNPKFKFIKANLLQPDEYRNQIKNFNFVVNFAAESHVDRSISEPDIFFQSNALGVSILTRTCMENGVGRFIQVSTDEVYGPVNVGESDEKTILNPSSPYSASKAGGELFSLSFWHTYGFPVVITRGSNTYGPRQYPEKLIPLALNNLRAGKKIPLYGTGLQTREWTYVIDHAEAIYRVMLQGDPGSIYNIGSGQRFTNLEIVSMLIKKMGRSANEIEFVIDRKGHDFRYALDCSLIKRQLNWSPKRPFEEYLEQINDW